jgi:hypothetical protein
MLEKLFGKKKRISSKDAATAKAIALHILNAEHGATAKIKKVRT